MMSHEKLDVYQCAIRFVRLAMKVGTEIPRGYGPLADQLRRASMCIPLQIAEGAGKRSGPDCRRFFDYARGSAMECCAALDVMRECGFGHPDELIEGKELLDRICAMLTRLAGRASSPAPGRTARAHASDTDTATERAVAGR